MKTKMLEEEEAVVAYNKSFEEHSFGGGKQLICVAAVCSKRGSWIPQNKKPVSLKLKICIQKSIAKVKRKIVRSLMIFFVQDAKKLFRFCSNMIFQLAASLLLSVQSSNNLIFASLLKTSTDCWSYWGQHFFIRNFQKKSFLEQEF